jgi:hypothetical protein
MIRVLIASRCADDGELAGIVGFRFDRGSVGQNEVGLLGDSYRFIVLSSPELTPDAGCKL